MQNLRNIVTSITFVLVIFTSLAANAQTDCITLPPELKDLIKFPTKTSDLNPEIQNRSSRSGKVISNEAGMIDFLVEFNNAFKNRNRLSKSEKDQNDRIFTDLKNDLEDNKLYNELKSIVGSSKSVDEIRTKIKQKIKSAKDDVSLETYMLFDYQVQILDSYGALIPGKILPSLTKGGPNVADLEFQEGFWDAVWDVFMGAAAGATVAGASGAAGCTVVVPVIGTVACGVVGAVGGAIVGAIYTVMK